MKRFSLGFVFSALVWAKGSPESSPQKCRCLPSDDCWPSSTTWAALNATVGGRLVKTIPIGSPCHDPTYDEEACISLQNSWDDPRLHLPSSSSIMQHYFANQSCDPFTPRSQPCELGNYVTYAIQVADADDVVAGVNFARDNNIRLVIRNTGHDFLGRSTGAGALSIWTHQLNSTEVITYTSPGYTGPALVAGAGVQGSAALETASSEDLVVVSGTCPSVGFVGGFLQGGGHSPLSTAFGLAADQVLEYKVVTSSGDIVVTSSTENRDLFWALSGGGGGTYGVVLEATLRAHPAAEVGGARIQLAANTTSKENFASVVTFLHEMLPDLADRGIGANYILNGEFFSVGPFTALNYTGDHLRDEVLRPFTEYLGALSVPFLANYSTLSYRDHFDSYLGPLPWGSLRSSEYQYGSRLIPRKTIEGNNKGLQQVIAQLISNGVILVATTGSFISPHPVDNSVLPAWRDALMQLQISTPWDNSPDAWSAMIDDQKRISEEYMPTLKHVTPGSGSYMNEGDIRGTSWKSESFGENYDKLLKVKRRWDPEGLFYIFKGVGSDFWTLHEDGRMCRT